MQKTSWAGKKWHVVAVSCSPWRSCHLPCLSLPALPTAGKPPRWPGGVVAGYTPWGNLVLTDIGSGFLGWSWRSVPSPTVTHTCRYVCSSANRHGMRSGALGHNHSMPGLQKCQVLTAGGNPQPFALGKIWAVNNRSTAYPRKGFCM